MSTVTAGYRATGRRASSVPRYPFGPRGDLSATVMSVVAGPGPAPCPHVEAVGRRVLREATDVVRDDDVQLTLFVLYSLATGTVPQAGAEWEWSPDLIRLRTALEGAFEDELRARVHQPVTVPPTELPALLFALAAEAGGPDLARFVAARATVDQVREMLALRSVYTLREADPHTWAIPRLAGPAKAALVEIQADEYGGGRPDLMHSAMFARALRGAGLDDTYGRYVDHVPAITLASHNLMSFFGMNRRLRGAVVGHLAAYEMTSSVPHRLYANGLRRLGFGEDVTAYFDEHVRADAAHEQLAAHDLAGALVEDDPSLVDDVLFGAAACLMVDGWVGAHVLGSWRTDRSALRYPLPRCRPLRDEAGPSTGRVGSA